MRRKILTYILDKAKITSDYTLRKKKSHIIMNIMGMMLSFNRD